MLIFLVCLNVLALSIFLLWYANEKNNENISAAGFALLLLITIVLIILIFVLICWGPNNREKANQLNIDYANLNYYVHHLEDYNERTLVEAINKYNVELKDFRAKQSSLWLNWFYPGDVSECEYIIWVN